MQIDISEITNGSRNGEILFVCDFRRPDLHKMPIRSVRPTKVLVRDNEEIATRNNIYYSQSHFVPLSKTGNPLKKAIAPFDNTGFRSFTGVPLNVFDDYEECVECWNRQVEEVATRLEEYRSTVVEDITNEIAALREQKE